MLRLVSLQMQYSRGDGGVPPRYDEGEDMVRKLQANETGVDSKLQQAQINLFSNQQPLSEGRFEAQNGAAAQLAESGPESDAESAEDDSGSEADSDALSDGDDDVEAGEDDEAAPTFKNLPKEEAINGAQGRKRRRAVFGTEPIQPAADGSSSDDEDEGLGDEEEEEQIQDRLQSGSSAESSGRDDSDAESQDSEGQLCCLHIT